jgi:hypothetical protein
MPKIRIPRGSPYEQARLASRWLHDADDRLWSDFPRYWMAFNALYNAVVNEGEPEVVAVMRVIQLFVNRQNAEDCLYNIDADRIRRLMAVPPGDDRIPATHPNYRKKTAALIERFRESGNPVERLAALMAIIYQVRCNLVHGSKDPTVMRDQELVSTCTPILEIVVSRLTEIMRHHHEVPILAAHAQPGGGLPEVPR